MVVGSDTEDGRPDLAGQVQALESAQQLQLTELSRQCITLALRASDLASFGLALTGPPETAKQEPEINTESVVALAQELARALRILQAEAETQRQAWLTTRLHQLAEERTALTHFAGQLLMAEENLELQRRAWLLQPGLPGAPMDLPQRLPLLPVPPSHRHFGQTTHGVAAPVCASTPASAITRRLGSTLPSIGPTTAATESTTRTPTVPSIRPVHMVGAEQEPAPKRDSHAVMPRAATDPRHAETMTMSPDEAEHFDAAARPKPFGPPRRGRALPAPVVVPPAKKPSSTRIEAVTVLAMTTPLPMDSAPPAIPPPPPGPAPQKH